MEDKNSKNSSSSVEKFKTDKKKIQEEFEKSIKKGEISEPIVEKIYNIAFRQVEEAEKQREILDTKAETLIRTIGIVIPLILGICGFLFPRFISLHVNTILIKKTSISLNSIYLILSFFFIVLMVLLLSTVKVLLNIIQPTSKYWTINYENVFNEEISKQGYSIYMLRLSIHYWDIFLNNYEINEEKGQRLKKAYLLFQISLFVTLFIALLILIILYVFQNFSII